MKLITTRTLEELGEDVFALENIRDSEIYKQIQGKTGVQLYGLSSNAALLMTKIVAQCQVPKVIFTKCDLNQNTVTIAEILALSPITNVEFDRCNGVDWGHYEYPSQDINALKMARAFSKSDTLELMGFSGSLKGRKDTCLEIINILSKAPRLNVHIDFSENFSSSEHLERYTLDVRAENLNYANFAYKCTVLSLLQLSGIMSSDPENELSLLTLIGEYFDDSCHVTINC